MFIAWAVEVTDYFLPDVVIQAHRCNHKQSKRKKALLKMLREVVSAPSLARKISCDSAPERTPDRREGRDRAQESIKKNLTR